MYKYRFSFTFFGDLVNYTFLETLGPTEPENQCLHFFQNPYSRHFGFSKWRPLVSEKIDNTAGSKHHRDIICGVKLCIFKVKGSNIFTLMLIQYIKDAVTDVKILKILFKNVFIFFNNGKTLESE